MPRPRTEDITGQRFGKLVALEIAGKDAGGRLLYKCRCDCGNITTVRKSNLGRTKSCGCSVGGKTKARIFEAEAEPRRDCNAYDPELDRCLALTEMLCKSRGSCKFYKSRVTERREDNSGSMEK